jgi:heavy metal response regulator
MRVLVVEDHEKVGMFIVKGLREESFAVDLARNGTEGLHLARTEDYDLIVLDVMLPGMSGLEVIRALREEGVHTPILVLTAREKTADKVAGLNAGADDYLTKPFEFEELLARLRALLRRPAGAPDFSLEAGGLRMDLRSRSVHRDEEEIVLTPKEFALLEYLFRNREYPVSRTSILEHVWDIHFDTDTNVVDVLIRYLRRKIDDGREPKLIHTVRGVGYMLKVDA